MTRKFLLASVLLALVSAGCGSSSDRVEPVLTEADRVGPGALTQADLVAVAALEAADDLYRMPEDPDVFVRVRSGEPPLMFTTECANLFHYDLPADWEATCTRRTTETGGVEEGVFLYRTIVGKNAE